LVRFNAVTDKVKAWREQQRPSSLAPEQLQAIQRLGSDIRQVWAATTTTARDRKELLRTLLEEVILNLKRAEGRAHLTLRWRGGAVTALDVAVPKFRPMGPRTDEDTISLLRRLAALYPDEVIAGILNRQGRKTATGERFTTNQVGSLRRYRNIARFQPPAEPPAGELVSIRKAAQILGMNTSSIHRWLADGFIAGEQVTPGAWLLHIGLEIARNPGLQGRHIGDDLIVFCEPREGRRYQQVIQVVAHLQRVVTGPRVWIERTPFGGGECNEPIIRLARQSRDVFVQEKQSF